MIRMKQGKWKTVLAAGALAAMLPFASPAPVRAQAADSTSRYIEIIGSQSGLKVSGATDSRYTTSSAATTGTTSTGTTSKASGNSSSSSSGSSSGSKDKYTPNYDTSGPGIETTAAATQAATVAEVGTEAQTSGPTVYETSLSETYHEEYGVYEEGLNDLCYLYTNVENGGLTDQAVKIDIPANVTYTMEKDGVGIGYTSGQAVSDRGSYVLRISVTDTSKSFSQQTVYKAVFRFRIQEKLPQATAEDSMNGGGYSSGSSMYSYTDNSWTGGTSYNSGDSSGASDVIDFGTGDSSSSWWLDDGETAAGETSGDSSSDETEIMDEDGNIDESAVDEAINAALGIDADGNVISDAAEISEVSGLASGYDAESGLYAHALKTGAVFYTDVPNGMVTTSAVTIRFFDDTLTLTAYRNGEEVELTSGEALTAPGSYAIYPTQDTAAYASAYSANAQPVFRFRIMADVVNDLGIFNAPENTLITQVTRYGITLFSAEKDEDAVRWYAFPEDGSYEITMKNELGELYSYVVLDTEAPRFSVTTEPNRAYVSYYSDDIANCVLYKNGNQQSEGELVSQVNGSGSYTLVVYDTAGNASMQSFDVHFSLNMGAVLAIVLVIALIAAGILFLKRARSDVKIR